MPKIKTKYQLYTLISEAIAIIAIFVLVFLMIFNRSEVVTPSVQAGNLSIAKDTITDSDTSVVTNHTIQFKTVSAVSASTTVTIDFPGSFKSTTSPAFANTDALDYDMATTSVELGEREMEVFVFGQCPGADTGYATSSFEITSITIANLFTFTHCNGTPDLPAGVTTTIEMGTHAAYLGAGTSRLENPDETGSYVVAIGTNSGTDSADARIFIIDDIDVAATVDSSFIFTLAGINSGGTECTETINENSTAITLPFGTMASGVAKVLAQDLTIGTNAANGFVVTIQQDQNPTATGGSDIDVFDDGTAQTTPAAWSIPAGSLASEDTYGHYGYTSEDSNLNGGEFTAGGQKYAGFNSTNADEIFSHNGPADEATADIGRTQVCYKMEISGLQEAANDYTNAITYIATPTF